eukprot:COSAG05_NODE_347_length_10963_cov_157.340943_2_plen_235_part_00
MPYSVFVSLWSSVFIEVWVRRRNELAFLWGSEDARKTATVRYEFIGVEQLNEKTGRESIEHADPVARAAKLGISFMFSLVIIFIVIFCAYSAATVRFYQLPPHCYKDASNFPLCSRCEPLGTAGNFSTDGSGWNDTVAVQMLGFDDLDRSATRCNNDPGMEWVDGYAADATTLEKNKWKWTSAFMNLLLIQIFGPLYRRTAQQLNDWENHRTQVRQFNIAWWGSIYMLLIRAAL